MVRNKTGQGDHRGYRVEVIYVTEGRREVKQQNSKVIFYHFAANSYSLHLQMWCVTFIKPTLAL